MPAGSRSAAPAQSRPRSGPSAAVGDRSPNETDDLAQECLLTAHRKLGDYGGHGPFEAWLARIAVRLCYDALCRRWRGRYVKSLGEADTAREPHDLASELEVRDTVHRLLARLPPADRLVLTLQLLEGHSVQEIAALTLWSPINVRVRSSRARSRAAQPRAAGRGATDCRAHAGPPA